jgi:hypothetical protein
MNNHINEDEKVIFETKCTDAYLIGAIGGGILAFLFAMPMFSINSKGAMVELVFFFLLFSLPFIVLRSKYHFSKVIITDKRLLLVNSFKKVSVMLDKINNVSSTLAGVMIANDGNDKLWDGKLWYLENRAEFEKQLNQAIQKHKKVVSPIVNESSSDEVESLKKELEIERLKRELAELKNS